MLKKNIPLHSCEVKALDSRKCISVPLCRELQGLTSVAGGNVLIIVWPFVRELHPTLLQGFA